MRTNRTGAERRATPCQRVLDILVGASLLAAAGYGVMGLVVVAADDSGFNERFRPEAEAICRDNPDTYRKYLNADGTDPAPDMTPFEYCVVSHLSHMPPD